MFGIDVLGPLAMALMSIVDDLMQSYDMATVNEEFVADGVHTISPTETPVQIFLPKMQVGSVDPKWIEQELTAKTCTIGSTYAASDATMTLGSGDATNLFPPDSTYNVQILVGQEVLLATAKGGSAAKIAVTHSYGSTTAAGHASGAKVTILSDADTEGQDAKKAATPTREKPLNYLQTFSHVIETSRVQERVNKLGGIVSEQNLNREIAEKKVALDLEAQLLHGVLSDTNSGAGSASMPRFMKGILGFLLATAVSDSGSIDTDAIEADIQTIWDEGGNPRAIICGGTMAQNIANLYADRIRTDVQTAVGGVAITSIINPLGDGPIAIIPHRLMPSGTYYMLDTARIALGFLDAFFLETVESEADGDKERVVGDYTLLFQNVKAHIMRYGFS